MTLTEAYRPSPKLPADELELFLKFVRAVRRYGAARNIPFSVRMGLRRPVTSPRQTAPLCGCGCDERVTQHRGKWAWYAKGHQPTPGMSAKGKAKISRRMRANNPMKRPEVAQRMAAKMRGRNNHTPEGLKAIAAAARHRMLTANPMREAKSFAKSMANRTSPLERLFKKWFKAAGLPIDFTADGTGFIKEICACPDFVVRGQKKAIEVGTGNSRGSRYCKSRLKQMQRAGWKCLIILTDHVTARKQEIMNIVTQFVKGNISCAWKNGRFLPWNVSTGISPSITFRAVRAKATSPTA